MGLILAQSRAYSWSVSGRKLSRSVQAVCSSLPPLTNESECQKQLHLRGLEVLQNAEHPFVDWAPDRAHSTQQLKISKWEHWYQDEFLMSR